MKPTFPFHYACHLAEELCGKAKKELNRTTGFAFHKIQDSFCRNLRRYYWKRTFTQDDVSFKYGPYNIENAEKLLNWVKEISEKDAPKSGIRKWLSLLYKDKHEAELWLDRVKEVTSKNYVQNLNLANQFEQSENKKTTHLYDVMSLASIMKGGK